MERLTKEHALPMNTRGRPAKYPWDEWFTLDEDGIETTLKLEKGVDFTIETEHFRIVVMKAAERRDGIASTRIIHEGDREFLKVTYRLPPDIELEKT